MEDFRIRLIIAHLSRHFVGIALLFYRPLLALNHFLVVLCLVISLLGAHIGSFLRLVLAIFLIHSQHIVIVLLGTIILLVNIIIVRLQFTFSVLVIEFRQGIVFIGGQFLNLLLHLFCRVIRRWSVGLVATTTATMCTTTATGGNIGSWRGRRSAGILNSITLQVRAERLYKSLFGAVIFFQVAVDVVQVVLQRTYCCVIGHANEC